MNTAQQTRSSASGAAPCSASWVSVEDNLPEDGEWVLHTYYGVRAPEYGIFINGLFCRSNGPESFPVTHWLPVPFIEQNT